ncbi:RNA 3'-terminal phosphate cyclase/enolpyruvate transferase [Dichotomopilus funicola]|uniref:RNA 3'-terminal phosphate cyclase/enolpyruvate transferase n=1 Tax=Dichotomopilus funicola TaxID=1934379 RepID=A0AAN6V599_9PEZI|nr:RNA 3'-terminal phosphate cyclase/enolpyruvate transferase [Dichotomopilus funicola]
MAGKDKLSVIELDGRTGEGGGQLVRIACALAAVASQPIRIINVRGNREGTRGGGLKAQHVTAIEFLAKATGAEVDGLFVGSHTLDFRPHLQPSDIRGPAAGTGRNKHGDKNNKDAGDNNKGIISPFSHGSILKIAADTPAASTMLIFQAVFPFLLFAAASNGSTHSGTNEITITGGTNVAFSLSFEYLDQVLLPTLEDAFGIRVERKLLARGWSLGKQQRGKVEFKFKPLKLGEALKIKEDATVALDGKIGGVVYGGGAPLPAVEDVEGIDVSIIVPSDMRESMADALVEDLEQLFPDVDINIKVNEDSGADTRIYVLLVAKAGVVRWGRDILTSMPKKAKAADKGAGSKAGKGGSSKANNGTGNGGSSVSAAISRKLAKELYEEVSSGGVVDEYLQDQLVIFQALAEGRTSFPRGEAKDSLEQAVAQLSQLTLHHDDDHNSQGKKTDKPFGEGSTHTTTARWVTAQLLPGVKWYNKGLLCEGTGVRMEKK